MLELYIEEKIKEKRKETSTAPYVENTFWELQRTEKRLLMIANAQNV